MGCDRLLVGSMFSSKEKTQKLIEDQRNEYREDKKDNLRNAFLIAELTTQLRKAEMELDITKEEVMKAHNRIDKLTDLV